MSAQYTPYRDLSSGEQEADCPSDWGDSHHPRGYVQIYEKTVEDRMHGGTVPRNLLVGGLALALFGALLGVLIGYFAHSNHSNCIPSLVVALHAVRDEDPTIRARILNMVDANRIKDDIKRLSTTSRPVGSEKDLAMVEEMSNLWKAEGLDKVQTAVYSVRYSEPGAEPNLLVQESTTFLPPPAATDSPVQGNPFSAYSPIGTVTGSLVYANTGSQSDLTYLTQVAKVDLKDKLVLVRHSQELTPIVQVQNLRPYKISGLLLYPDPSEYNPPILRSQPYPESIWLPPDAVVQQATWWNALGDPETIGYPSTSHAYRLPQERDELLSPFPVQPISYGEAYHYLRLLEGTPRAPDSWQGNLNFSYSVGPSNQSLSLESHNSFVYNNVHNLIGYIAGRVEPDRYVILGSQRDSLSPGAVDAASGTAVLLELVRVFGKLRKEGWQPRRTIVFCSFGAEEYGWVGATEWVEDNLKLLRERAVAYINVDDLVFDNTSISAVASPLLFHALFNATKEVPNPVEDDEAHLRTVYDVWLHTFTDERNVSQLLFPEYGQAVSDSDNDLDYEELFMVEPQDNSPKKLHDVYMKSAMMKRRPKVNVGSPYRTSVEELVRQIGIPFVDLTYITDHKITDVPYPLYRTKYDTFEALKKFVDPTFKVHKAMACVLAELTRDIADSLFLPFNLLDFAQHLREQALLVQFNLTASARKENIDYDPGILNTAILVFTDSARKFHKMQEESDLSDPMTIRRINDKLLILERIFLDPVSIRRNVSASLDSSQSALHPLLRNLVMQGGGGGGLFSSPPGQFPMAKTYELLYYYLVFACESAARVLEELI